MGTVLNHTPGPWQRNISAKYPIYAERTPGKKDWVHVAAALPCPEAEANLRLIAAAPDLLAELESLVAGNYGQPRGVTVPALDNARALIAKARGE
jgi:hypothetical protein